MIVSDTLLTSARPRVLVVYLSNVYTYRESDIIMVAFLRASLEYMCLVAS